MDDRVIFHIDVNSAFLSWEAVHRLQDLGEELDLRTIPSAVGGDMSKRHGVILAKSIPAKKYNVRTGEPIVDALRKCPNLTLVSPNRELYARNSAAFMEILRRYSDTVEQYSIDEAFADMTGTEGLFGSPIEAAHRVKDEIRDTLGFTVNVGISSNKLLAKMAGEFEKPDKVHTLFPGEIQEKLWPLPVGELFSVGGASEQKLKRLGIMTIGDLAQADLGTLQATLKKHGEAIWNYANGRDFSLVEAERADNKGYGNSVTLSYDVTRAEEAKQVLLSLAETVGRRLRRDGAWIEVVSVTLRFFDLTQASHQCVLEHATNITDEIYQAACRLFDEFWDRTPIRLIGIQTGKVTREGDNRQLSLFDDTDYEKLERLDRAMDSIREKFGADAVRRASFLQKDRPDI
nr:DNA polymerase IV [uncultured Acetatifactor sp.]